jgi:hypothetical protein
MRVLFGMILGALLTVGGAFVHDTWSVGPSTTGAGVDVTTHRQMVNWDVVGDSFRVVSDRAREGWSALSQKISS